MIIFKVALFPFEFSDPVYLPITQETAKLLVRAWELHDRCIYISIFDEALEEASTAQAKRTARDRLFENTCIVIEDDVHD